MAGMRTYTGRVAAVTGASSGLGAGLARELARRGMRVALVARRRERLEELVAAIGQAGGEASAHVCDVAQPEQVVEAAREIKERWGPIDLLVNSAGYVRHVLFKDHDPLDIAHMMQTNFLGAVSWIKAVLPEMRERSSGWIVNISSFAGIVPQPDEAAYTATKFALSGLSDALVHELAPLGIHVMSVHPVLVRTEMFTPEILARMPRASLGTFIEVEEFVTRVLRSLERGKRSIVVPGRFRAVHLLRTLLPGVLDPLIARVKLAAVPDLRD